MKLNLSIVFLLLSLCTFGQKATISGVITDKDLNNEPLAFANIVIKGTTNGATTDIEGKYAIETTAGTHTLVFSFLGYESKELTLTIAEGETKTINQTLGSGSVSLQDVVVKATASKEKETALLLEQKKAVEIKQSIGAQEMSRKGVSDVEEGLTKITGISKVESRGLFVRGLEDRYNNLLINDLAVPSNNPFKKILPLDIFPTDIVSIIETYKTFNTNIYGDFAGGTFNIVTANSGKSQTKVNFGAGYTTGNNLSSFLRSKDASSTSDFFGFSGNERDIPKVIGKSIPSNHIFTKEEAINGFGSGFDVEEDKSPLNTNFGVTHTQKFNIGEKQNSFQYLLSANFDNKYQVRKGVDRFFDPSNLGNYDNNLVTTKYKYTTNSSLLGALNFKSKRLNVTSNTFFLNSTENTIQDQLGFTNGNSTQKNTFIRLNELQQTKYLNTQLFAKYKLTSNERHNVKAGVSYTKTNMELPDRKSFKGIKIDDQHTAISYGGNSISRQYYDYDGKYHISGLGEYSWNFGKKEIEESNKLTIGYNGYINKMNSKFRFVISQPISGAAASDGVFNTNTPDSQLASEIQSGNVTYKDGSTSSYKSKLFEFVNAGYLDLALKFGDKVDVNAGVRAEQTTKEIKYRPTGSFDDPYTVVTTEKLDFLPSVNGKYKLTENSNIRLAASKTITRPVTMEALPSEFVNPDGTLELGNIKVKNSDNYNVDLKYELFPTNKELLSVTAFSKIIQNPIERLFTPSAGSGGQIITYDNSKKATLYGAELEAIFQLDKISNVLKNFSIGTNVSYLDSKVEIYKTKDNKTTQETIAADANPTRKLQGASSWIINSDLKYESEFSKNWKNTMTFVYNRYSKRIYAVGTNKLDHYYEMPFDKLDFVWGNKLGEKWDVKFSVDNILNPKYKIEMGDQSRVKINESDLTIKDYKKGVGFSFNLAYTF